MREARTRSEQTEQRGLASRPRGPKLTRAQKSEQIKAALFEAAGKIVAERGYLNAMIQMITARANVANGTFYNYFDSQQDLFDQLLPRLGREMLTFIGERSQGGIDEVDKERRRMLAFFEFLQERPEFYRVLYEAEVFAPAAFEQHMSLVTRRYLALLERAARGGHIKGYSSQELEVIVLILMGARQYMAMAFGAQNGGDAELPEWAIGAYIKFIAGGFRALAEGDEGPESS
jgi:AcrR family transcriptional regulator